MPTNIGRFILGIQIGNVELIEIFPKPSDDRVEPSWYKWAAIWGSLIETPPIESFNFLIHSQKVPKAISLLDIAATGEDVAPPLSAHGHSPERSPRQWNPIDPSRIAQALVL